MMTSTESPSPFSKFLSPDASSKISQSFSEHQLKAMTEKMVKFDPTVKFFLMQKNIPLRNSLKVRSKIKHRRQSSHPHASTAHHNFDVKTGSSNKENLLHSRAIPEIQLSHYQSKTTPTSARHKGDCASGITEIRGQAHHNETETLEIKSPAYSQNSKKEQIPCAKKISKPLELHKCKYETFVKEIEELLKDVDYIAMMEMVNQTREWWIADLYLQLDYIIGILNHLEQCYDIDVQEYKKERDKLHDMIIRFRKKIIDQKDELTTGFAEEKTNLNAKIEFRDNRINYLKIIIEELVKFIITLRDTGVWDSNAIHLSSDLHQYLFGGFEYLAGKVLLNSGRQEMSVPHELMRDEKADPTLATAKEDLNTLQAKIAEHSMKLQNLMTEEDKVRHRIVQALQQENQLNQRIYALKCEQTQLQNLGQPETLCQPNPKTRTNSKPHCTTIPPNSTSQTEPVTEVPVPSNNSRKSISLLPKKLLPSSSELNNNSKRSSLSATHSTEKLSNPKFHSFSNHTRFRLTQQPSAYVDDDYEDDHCSYESDNEMTLEQHWDNLTTPIALSMSPRKNRLEQKNQPNDDNTCKKKISQYHLESEQLECKQQEQHQKSHFPASTKLKALRSLKRRK